MMKRSLFAPFAVMLCSLIASAQDDCATSTLVLCPSATAGTTVGATAEVGVPAGCAGAPTPGVSQNFTYTNSVWFRVVSPISGTITADTLASAFDSKIFVFSGTCGALSCVSANDNINVAGSSKVAWSATLGTTYFLMVGPSGAAGPFTLTLGSAAAPSNDDCASPIVLSPLEGGSTGGTTSGSTTPSYTSATAYASCSGTGGIFDVWYQFRACATGSMALATCGAFDTVLSAHTACPGSAGPSNEIACNDDGSGGCAPGSQITFAVSAGSFYVVRVAGKSGAAAGGSFVLTWAMSGIPAWYQDADGDGYGNASQSVVACAPPGGYVSNANDCNDANAAINPSALEVCDGIDNDCDTLTDDADPSVAGQATFYQDADGDGFGNLGVSTLACVQPGGFVANSADCNDGNAAVNPNATEICNGIDDDCDALTDDADPGIVGQPTWYQDGDGDGFGNPGVPVISCVAPPGYVASNTDCNDANASAFPGAPEVCDGVDNDCDNAIDEGCPSNDFCFNATPIGNGQFFGANTNAASEIADLTCGPVEHDVWWSYTNTGNCDRDVTASICPVDGGGASFDSVMHVFSGSCGALSLVACNDNACGLDPRITFSVPVGETRLIAVSAHAGNPGGGIVLSVFSHQAMASTSGPGCAPFIGPSGGATLTIDDKPYLGSSRTLTITGAAPSSVCVLLFSGGGPMVSVLNGGCPILLEVGTQVLWLLFITDGSGGGVVVETVPGDPVFDCLRVRVQGFIFPNGGVPGYQTTSGLDLTLGF